MRVMLYTVPMYSIDWIRYPALIQLNKIPMPITISIIAIPTVLDMLSSVMSDTILNEI